MELGGASSIRHGACGTTTRRSTTPAVATAQYTALAAVTRWRPRRLDSLLRTFHSLVLGGLDAFQLISGRARGSLRICNLNFAPSGRYVHTPCLPAHTELRGLRLTGVICNIVVGNADVKFTPLASFGPIFAAVTELMLHCLSGTLLPRSFRSC